MSDIWNIIEDEQNRLRVGWWCVVPSPTGGKTKLGGVIVEITDRVVMVDIAGIQGIQRYAIADGDVELLMLSSHPEIDGFELAALRGEIRPVPPEQLAMWRQIASMPHNIRFFGPSTIKRDSSGKPILSSFSDMFEGKGSGESVGKTFPVFDGWQPMLPFNG